jgi:hypothetical protein
MPEALACCHLCDHLGLLVSNTIIPTFSKTFFAKFESLNSSLLCHLFRDFRQARVLLPYHTAKYGHEVSPLESRRMQSLTTVSFPFFSDVLDFIIFQGFLVCVHYMLETVRRPFPSRSLSSSFKRLLFGRSPWLAVRTQALCATRSAQGAIPRYTKGAG